MKHSFRKRLISGELLIGTMVTFALPEVSELLTEVGYEWLFIDVEHGPFDTRDAQMVLQGAGTGVPCVVRVANNDEVAIKRALDIGAAGVIVPQVNSAEQAAQVVRFSKYSPLGSRGVGLARAHRYGLKFQEYVDSANNEIAVVVQAEHIDAIENIEAIVNVSGIDAVLVGPYDLSASLGKLGQVDDAEVVQAIKRVTEVCLAAGIRLGIFGVSADAVKPYIDQGYTLITAGVDALMLGNSATQLLGELRD